MPPDDLRRLRNQRLIGPGFETPAEVAGWLGAVQAQDYNGAKWAVAQRMTTATDADLDAALDRGDILRTHILRPTWHLVALDDVRWIQALTAPRVHQLNGSMYRNLELDSETLAHTSSLMTSMLAGGNHLTRKEIGTRLAGNGIGATGQRLAYIVMYAELEALICSGPRQGKQQTYALVDERSPKGRALDRDEALARLAERFFRGHGPATAYDFAWWSGLTIADVKRGVAMASGLESADYDGATWWAEPDWPEVDVEVDATRVHLLPNYDEYFSRDNRRSPYPGADAMGGRAEAAALAGYAHHVVIDGEWRGGWRRTIGTRSATVELDPTAAYTAKERAALDQATAAYGQFLDLPVAMT